MSILDTYERLKEGVGRLREQYISVAVAGGLTETHAARMWDVAFDMGVLVGQENVAVAIFTHGPFQGVDLLRALSDIEIDALRAES